MTTSEDDIFIANVIKKAIELHDGEPDEFTAKTFSEAFYMIGTKSPGSFASIGRYVVRMLMSAQPGVVYIGDDRYLLVKGQ